MAQNGEEAAMIYGSKRRRGQLGDPSCAPAPEEKGCLLRVKRSEISQIKKEQFGNSTRMSPKYPYRIKWWAVRDSNS